MLKIKNRAHFFSSYIVYTVMFALLKFVGMANYYYRSFK